MPTTLDIPTEVVVYCTWYGYSQCDPLAAIGGTSREDVLKAVYAAMDEEEERSKDSCDTRDDVDHDETDCPFCDPHIVWAGTIFTETAATFMEYCGVDDSTMRDLLSGEVVYVSP